MSYDIQATVDLCFNIASFRNLTHLYIRSLFFQLTCNTGENQSTPYLIISDNQNPSSITLLDYVSPLYSMGPHAKVSLDELVVFRVNVPVSQLAKNGLKYKFVFYQSLQDKTVVRLDEVEIVHKSVLWVNNFCPVFSVKCGCAVDVAIQSQLLKVRVRNIKIAPKSIMIEAVQHLLLSYNKLKNRLNNNKSLLNEEESEKEYNFDLICQEVMLELEQVTKISSKRRIFEEEEERIKNKEMVVDFAQKYLPLIGDLVLQNWQTYLKQMKGKSIQQQRQTFISSLQMLVKNNVFQNSEKKTNQNLYIDTMRIRPFLVSLKEISRQQEPAQLSPKHHFLFLVHGYGATSLTMLPLELSLRYLYPQLIILNSKFNEDKTEDNFQNMGKRLATEIEMFIKNEKCGEDYGMSFVAHSLGGLIVRSALTQMEGHKYHMKNFITLATPHFGHLFHNSSINKFGMWAFSKLRKSEVMDTLLLSEQGKNKRDSYIYQLSSVSGLNWFQKVFFYGCPTDKFVSVESSLCTTTQQIQDQFSKNSENALIWTEMQKSISHILSQTSCYKYEVDFSGEVASLQKSFADEWLGRKDHMHFCLSSSFIRILCSNRMIFR